MEPELKMIGEVKNGNIHVTVSEYNGVKYLDIRKYYKDEAGELKPTKKGIALNKTQFQETLNILNEKKGEIESLL